MKKITLLLSFIACVLVAQAQTSIYYETCGTMDVATAGANYRPKVDLYTGWDNQAPITYTRTTTLDGFADVRIITGATNNVWFPAAKGSDLIISNIPAIGYKNLKLSFDVATYTLTGTNVNKVNVYCNGTLLAVPSAAFVGSNTFQSIGTIDLVAANVINLRFEYTAINNPTTIGYRLDNFKIVGDKVSGLNSLSTTPLSVSLKGNILSVSEVAEGSFVDVYSTVGAKVQSSKLVNGSIQLNELSKGLYVVRVGNATAKIML